MVLTVLLRTGQRQTREIRGRDPARGAGTAAAQAARGTCWPRGAAGQGGSPPPSVLPRGQPGAFARVLRGVLLPLWCPHC